MDRLIIIGGGGHAKVIISILMKRQDNELLGYLDKTDRGEILGVKYIGGDDTLEDLIANHRVNKAVLGIGQLKDSSSRRKLVNKVSRIGYSFPPVISPDSIVNQNVEIAEGTIVMDGAVINSGSKIGRFSIINTGVIVDHDCSIGDFTHVAPGSALSGGVDIGNDVLIGTGSSIIQNIKIVDSVVIGAGSAVCDDIIEEGTYGGIPAGKIGR